MKRKKYAVFTMDVEAFADTECLSVAGVKVESDMLDGMDEYIKILDRHGIKSTLFTVGDLAPKIAEQLKPHIANGHCLALHSYSHIAPIEVEPEQFRENIRRAREDMRELFGVEVKGFRAPCFSIDKQRLDIIRELGFRYDSSYLDFRQARHSVELDLSDFRQIRKGIFRKDDFYEFGLPKEKIFGKLFPISGGGYVRLSHWDFVKTLISHYIHKNDYYVFYLHPFELTKQKIPVYKELRSYDKYYLKWGVSKFSQRVEKIICMLKKCGYEFVTFDRLMTILDKEGRGVTKRKRRPR